MIGEGYGDTLWSDSITPRSRSHILPQRVALTRGRLDPEVPVVRRPPSLNDRLDLNQSIPYGEPTQRFFTPRARVAVDVNCER